jgi:hypothetical protein
MPHTVIRNAVTPWQGFDGIPGFLHKPLALDPDTGARILLWFVPPGWGEQLVGEEAMLHYHANAAERAYILYGDFPHWEFSTFDDVEGYLEVMKGGLFMDRPPKSLHGLKPGNYSQAGAMILYWATGPGTNVGDAEYHQESVDMLAGVRDEAQRTDLQLVRLFRPDDLAWAPHPSRSGWKIKHLAGDAGHGKAVSLVYAAPGWRGAAADAPIAGHTDSAHAWSFVLMGDMTLALGGAVEPLAQHDFVEWTADSPASLAGAEVGELGCLTLCIGHAMG